VDETFFKTANVIGTKCPSYTDYKGGLFYFLSSKKDVQTLKNMYGDVNDKREVKYDILEATGDADFPLVVEMEGIGRGGGRILRKRAIPTKMTTKEFLRRRGAIREPLKEPNEVKPLVVMFKKEQQDLSIQRKLAADVETAVKMIKERNCPPYIICPFNMSAGDLGKTKGHEVGLVVSKTRIKRRVIIGVFDPDKVLDGTVETEKMKLEKYNPIIVQLNNEKTQTPDNCTFYTMGFIVAASELNCNTFKELKAACLDGSIQPKTKEAAGAMLIGRKYSTTEAQRTDCGILTGGVSSSLVNAFLTVRPITDPKDPTLHSVPVVPITKCKGKTNNLIKK
jgi:hypothetical protein